jgi:hypothetical protein
LSAVKLLSREFDGLLKSFSGFELDVGKAFGLAFLVL